MIHEVLMPRVSDTMESGTVLQWLAAEGDAVIPGTPLVEVETDKVTLVVEAAAEGVLAGCWVPEGGEASPGAVLATIAPAGVEVTPPSAAAARPEQAAAAPVAPKPAVSAAVPGGIGLVRATPLARTLARTHGVDLVTVAGSGPNGRVLRQDVEPAIRRGAGRPGAVPQCYADAQVDVTEALRLIGPAGTTLTAFAERALALALARHAHAPEGSVTVADLGVHGVDTVHVVVDPPKTAVLSLGAVRRVPVVAEGGFHARDVVTISLSADGRVFPGLSAAAVLGDVRRLLEAPRSLR